MLIFPQNFYGTKRDQNSLSIAFKLGQKFLEVYKINNYIIEVIFEIGFNSNIDTQFDVQLL